MKSLLLFLTVLLGSLTCRAAIFNNGFTTNAPGSAINSANSLISNFRAGNSNIFNAFKFIVATNYTVLPTDTIIEGCGTNQLVTLLNGTNNATVGKVFCFVLSSTNSFQSMIVTNANGVQTLLDAASLSKTITNGQTLTLFWDGSNWR